MQNITGPNDLKWPIICPLAKANEWPLELEPVIDTAGVEKPQRVVRRRSLGGRSRPSTAIPALSD